MKNFIKTKNKGIWPVFTLLFVLLLCCKQVRYGQKKRESPLINDSIVMREIAGFTLHQTQKPGAIVKLQEIPLLFSNDSLVTLEKSNWIGVHRLVRIEIEEINPLKPDIILRDSIDSSITLINDKPAWGVSGSTSPKRKVRSILFFHVKGRYILPDSAFAGIYAPPIIYCKTEEDRKIGQKYFKAYLSEDNWRMYIYMLNGQGKDQYEVTWVINGFDYYGRFINQVPE